MAAPPQRRRAVRARRPLDLGALALAPLGIVTIVLAQVLGGVPIRALLQLEAGLIVFGGTLGAVLVSYSPRELGKACAAVLGTFRAMHDDLDALATTIVGLAARAHRRGLITIEAELEGLTEGYLREGLAYAIDEPSLESVRDVLDVECAARAAAEESPARLLDAAAGYSPTLGILGAVLGLIHVMRNLTAPGALGTGIAVAFVATVYGVGLANLVLLPLSGRIRERAAWAARRRDLMTHGICGIHQRVHPRMLAQKLRACGARPVTEARSSTAPRTARAARFPA